MLDKILKEIPKLTEAVVRADVRGNGSYDVAATGAADATRAAGRRNRGRREGRAGAQKARAKARRTGRPARAGFPDRPLRKPQRGRDRRARCPSSRRSSSAGSRSTSAGTTSAPRCSTRISTLRASEPWPGYDKLTVDELSSALGKANERRARAARDYERAHKNRAGVIAATERELANA